MESATLFRCVIVCLPLCARLWIHAHARTHDTKIHTHTHSLRHKRRRAHKQKWFRCVRSNSPHALPTTILCACVRETVSSNSPSFVEFNSTQIHTHSQQRTHTKDDLTLFFLSLSFVRTHTRPMGVIVCVRCVRVFWLHLLTFWRSTQTVKSPIAQNEMKWKKKRARFAVAPFLPLLLLTFFCHCCCRCRCLCCCQQHRAATAASASAAASFLFPSIIWHCVIINCCRAPLRRCSVLTTRQNEQQTAT